MLAQNRVRYFEITASPLIDAGGEIIACIAISRESTERRRMEELLKQTNRALSVLSQCNYALAHATQEKDLLQEICLLIVGDGKYKLAWIGLVSDESTAILYEAAQVGLVEKKPFQLGFFLSTRE